MTIPHFSETDLLDTFERNYFNRGKQYQKNGNILSISVNHQQNQMSGYVAGKRTEPYFVNLSISQKQHTIHFTGRCTCPMHHNCKHTVALALEYLAKEDKFAPPKPKSPVEQDNRFSLTTKGWLDELNKNSKKRKPVRQPLQQKAVVYVINKNEKTYSSGQLTISAHLANLLKSGRFSMSGKRAQKISHYNDGYEYFDAEDRVICHLLNNPDDYYADSVTLKDDYGEELLRRMIGTGRCYYADTKSKPVSLSKNVRLDLVWEETNNGYHIVPQVDAKTVPIYFIQNSAWVFDRNQFTFSKVDYDGGISLLETCVHSPAISYGEVSLVNEAISKKKKLPITTISAPSLQTIQLDPAPHIYVDHDRGYQGDKISLTLAFDYGETSVDWDDPRPVVYQKNDQAVDEIHRQITLEEHYLEILAKHGFAFVKHYYSRETEITRQLGPKRFISEIYPELKRENFRITFAESFPTELIAEQIDNWYTNIDYTDSSQQWFNLEVGVAIGAEKINLLPLLQQLVQQMPNDYQAFLQQSDNISCNLPDGRVIVLPAERVKKILGVIVDLFDKSSAENDTLVLSIPDITRINDIDDALEGCTTEQLDKVSARSLANKLSHFKNIPTATIPDTLQAELRPYQQEGVNWLQFLREYQFSGILADDMGLGKTLQVIAHICIEKANGRLTNPCLIIVPTSLVTNWELELSKFAPDLSILVLHGSDRKRHFDEIQNVEIIITTYPLLTKDEEILLNTEFYLTVLDEAQMIKNPKTKVARIVRKLSSHYRLCLSGTPLENHLGELWSLFNFAMPGLLGDMSQFTRHYRTPIEKHNDQDRKTLLLRRITPFIVRRNKNEVATELPPKTEMTQVINLNEKESDLYETIRLAMHTKITKAINEKGFARSQIVILDALLKLRQICCDARLLKIDTASAIKDPSSKLTWLMEKLPGLVQEGRKIILFSQFTQMLSLIEDAVKKIGIDYVLLTGQTKDRKTPISAFQHGKVPLFLISLKAGGVGLNLTAADVVIHFDPWWNPAIESQATDRAHRIGQDKPVFVYKLIAQNSVEEKILELQKKKSTLLEAILSSDSTKKAKLTNRDVEALFSS